MAALGAPQPPSLICYEDSREMFRLTYPLMQWCANTVAAGAGLQASGPDPMLLPAAPTVAKYLHPAVSTVSMTPRGMEIAMHQSLPNGNLGALLYLMLCSSLPENPDAWIGPAGATGGLPAGVEAKQAAVSFSSFTEREGPCPELASFSLSGNQEVAVELGSNIKGVCHLHHSEFFGKPMIGAGVSVKNISKERRGCQYYVALFDKGGKLIGCAGQELTDSGLAPAQKRTLPVA